MEFLQEFYVSAHSSLLACSVKIVLKALKVLIAKLMLASVKETNRFVTLATAPINVAVLNAYIL